MEIIELYDSLPAEDDGMVTFARAVLERWGHCPHIVTSDEGTSYCALAEQTANSQPTSNDRQIRRTMTSPMDELRQASADLQPIEDLTPPPELVQQWLCEHHGANENHWLSAVSESDRFLVDRAAQWGADQELEACCEWLDVPNNRNLGDGWLMPGRLRAARRPKPPSLKEQALMAINAIDAGTDKLGDSDIIRRALEALPE
jgi:hypothetical protein